MPGPWTFGWTQLLAVIGLILTVTIAVGGFRTFGRWKKEKIEEKRIDTAIDALAIVYEGKFVFDSIRSPMSFPSEYADMPAGIGTEAERNARGPYFAILRRVEAHKEFFERAWKTQVRCTALFGPKVEDTFLLIQRARREIEVSASMLYRDPKPGFQSEDNLKTWERFRTDVWSAYGDSAEIPDRVGKKLSDFQKQIEDLCRPIIDREYGRRRAHSLLGRAAEWLGMS
jgi:hypothetical protein